MELSIAETIFENRTKLKSFLFFLDFPNRKDSLEACALKALLIHSDSIPSQLLLLMPNTREG
jgi:hypothetical protein